MKLTSDPLDLPAADESALFAMPERVRERASLLFATDHSPWRAIWESRQDYLGQRPLAGSFFGVPTSSLGDVPRAATYLKLMARGTDLASLPSLRSLEVLEIVRATPDAVRLAAQLPALRMLRIGGIKDFDSSCLAPLHELEFLEISETRGEVDVAALPTLPKLRGLRLDARAVTGHTDIGRLTNIEVLELLTGGPGAPARMDTLAAIGQLRALRFLQLGHLRVEDGRLEPIGQLTRLRRLDLQGVFSIEQWAALGRKLPNVDPDLRSPFQQLGGQSGTKPFNLCGRCGTNATLRTKTAPSLRLCPKCNERALLEYVATWELLLAS